MLYELHLTTTPDADVEKWSALCSALGIKPLVIELDRGDHPRQVMMAATHSGDDRSVDNWRDTLVVAFASAGFPIVRQKLEVPLDKAGVYTKFAYHETHVKMLLSPYISDSRVRVAGWHTSRNALQTNVDGRSKWYLTRRAYGVDIHAAADDFHQEFGEIVGSLPNVRMEMETVLYDSNPSLDDGWAVS